MRRSVPKHVLIPPNLGWFKTRQSGSVDAVFTRQGSLVYLQRVGAVFGGETISFVVEYTYQFKDPISNAMTPAKSSCHWEAKSCILNPIEMPRGNEVSEIEVVLIPSSTVTAAVVEKDTVKSVIALRGVSDTPCSIEFCEE